MPAVTKLPETQEKKQESRLLLVSNRLPITIKRSEDGGYDFSMSSGGLVSGLSGLSKSTTFQWYGWPGLEVPENEAGPLKARLIEEYNAIPIFIDDELADRHYNGFSSKHAYTLRCNPLLTTIRLYPLAPVPLSPGRDHFRRIRMECLQRGKSHVREGHCKRCPRWRPDMGSRLSFDAFTSHASRRGW